MASIDWTDLMIALSAWFAIGLVVALVVGRILSRGQSQVRGGRVPSVLSFFMAHSGSGKNPWPARSKDKHEIDPMLTPQGPRTLSR